MKTLDTNRLFEIDRAGRYQLGLELMLAVSQGRDVLTCCTRDERFQPVHIDGCEPLQSHWCSLQRAVESLAGLEGSMPRPGRFLLRIGEQQLPVNVEESTDGADRTLVFRVIGVPDAKQRAAEILSDVLERRGTGNVSLLLDWNDPERVVFATERHLRRATLARRVQRFACCLLSLAGVAVLLGTTLLPGTLGAAGRVMCVVIGLTIALVICRWIRKAAR